MAGGDQAMVSTLYLLVPGLTSLVNRFIEEPTARDDILGHAAIRKALKPHGIGVATGEHA